tara:strand:- start:86 stop:340 length:255 start_codon:yes stop_codon:yes gene_type:complete
MRLDIKTITQIHDNLIAEGIDNVQIGYTEYESSFTLRFGYWKKATVSVIEMINGLLPNHLYLEPQIIDEDPECGELWTHIILKK